jgi:hypothetical protein
MANVEVPVKCQEKSQGCVGWLGVVKGKRRVEEY